MSDYGFPFNATLIDGVYDREYTADDFASYFGKFIGDGVYALIGNALEVIANTNNMFVTVKSGACFIKGRAREWTEETQLRLSNAHATYNRFDYIVARLSLIDRSIELAVVEGTPSANPIAPTLTRTDDIFELSLAVVKVQSGATSISQINITDKRDTSTCGFVSGLIDQIDAQSFFEQYTTAFNQWFETYQRKIDETTEISLWNGIDNVLTMPIISSGSCNDLGEVGKVKTYRVSGNVTNCPYSGGEQFIITHFGVSETIAQQIAMNPYNRSTWKRYFYSGSWKAWESTSALSNGTVVSSNADYGEVGTWSDLNPSNEDRLHRFVTIVGDNHEIAIANADSQIVGVSNLKSNVGFLGNYTDGDESDSSKVIVSILGVAYVKTNDSSIVANNHVMSDSNGYAIKSSNNLGYRVLSRSGDILKIVVSPNTDMIQRIKTDVSELQTKSFEGTSGTIETKGGYIHDLMIFGKSLQDGTPTPDNPIEIQSVVNPKVTVRGKNLFDLKGWLDSNDAVYEVLSDNSIDLQLEENLFTTPFTFSNDDIDITLSVEFIKNKTSENARFDIINKNGNDVASLFWTDNYKSLQCKGSKIRFNWSSKGTINFKNLQIEVGSVATEYEPYKEQSATLPYTLNAIPVTEGGNVTIDGQQYISDYVDIERKKLVRNVGEVELNGNSEERWDMDSNWCYLKNIKVPTVSEKLPLICNKLVTIKKSDYKKVSSITLSGGGYIEIIIPDLTSLSEYKTWLQQNPIKVIYQLATPTITTLTDEEVSQFKALQTYVPTSNIIASSDVLSPFISLEYSNNKEVCNIQKQINNLSFVTLTQTEYDSLSTIDNNTIYFITE